MALIQCNFFSDELKKASTMTVILPEQTMNKIGVLSSNDKRNVYPVLYLLHGLSDDNTNWTRYSQVEKFVDNMPLIVVMPNVDRSFYANMKNGPRYWDFISKELPNKVQQFFPASSRREDTFVAGLSMGGYGALKLGLSHPDKFSKIGCFSIAAKIGERIEGTRGVFDDQIQEFRNIFGSAQEFNNSSNNIFNLLEENSKNNVQIPSIFHACGTEDFLYEENVYFKDVCNKLKSDNKLDYTYFEEQGEHEWMFWNRNLKRFLDTLFNS